MERYNHLNSYLRNKFGGRVLKVCIDGGFTCPNRDGTMGVGGCIFCSSDGSGENIKYKCNNAIESIKSQVTNFLNSYRGERADKFIAYFQSFTNTYDTIDNLKIKYDTALSCSNKFVGLQIATRPDTINEDVARLISSYRRKYYVVVELGLQTASDDIGRLINRCYSTEQFITATNLLHKYGIDVVAHLMVGLPQSCEEDILQTVEVINGTHCEGIKIHSTYVVKNTILEDMYAGGIYTPLTMEYYVEMVGKIISRLDKNIVIHRINADPPKVQLVAPLWQTHKKLVINAINKHLEDNNIIQGVECDD